MPPRKKQTPAANNSTPKPTVAVSETDKDKREIPDFSTKNVWVFELTGNKPAILKLRNDANINRAYNEESKRYEAIRYCENEDSIWVSEQPEQVKKGSVAFSDGTLEVPYNQTTLLEFLFRHPEFNSSFRLLDRDRDAKEDLDQFELEFEAMSKAKKAPYSDLKLIALAKGLESSSEAVCRRHMYDYARRSPVDFLDAFDNDSIEVSAMLRMAMNQGVLSSDGVNLRWADSNQRIMTLPAGADPVAYASVQLVDKTNPQHQATLDELKRKLKL